MYYIEGPKKGSRAQRGGKDVERPKGSRPPCNECPKKSPQQAKLHELSYRNLKTLDVYYQSQCVDIDADAITRANLGLVHRIVRDHDQGTMAEILVTAIAAN